jgi:hypothetical protein
MDLMAALGMTEAEIIDAAFRSRHIKRHATSALYGSDSKLFLEYSDESSN